MSDFAIMVLIALPNIIFCAIVFAIDITEFFDKRKNKDT